MKSIDRRSWLSAAVKGLLGTALTYSLPSLAQSWPSRPIRLLVGIAPGGTADMIARLYGQNLSELLGTPVVIDNKPGAYQTPAIRAPLSAAPDGYTLYLGNGSSLASSPGIRKDLGYDPLKEFTLIAPVGISSAVIFANPDLPVRTLGELIAYSTANPDNINYGSAGAGNGDHIKIEHLKALTGLKATHVPYKSGSEVAAGNVQMGLTTSQTPVPFIRASKLRALAVTSAHSLSYLPGVPGTAEADIKGLDALEPYTFYGLVGPAGLPGPVVTQLNEAMNRVAAMPEVKVRMQETLYVEQATGTPDSIRQLTAREFAKATDLAKRVSFPSN